MKPRQQNVGNFDRSDVGAAQGWTPSDLRSVHQEILKKRTKSITGQAICWDGKAKTYRAIRELMAPHNISWLHSGSIKVRISKKICPLGTWFVKEDRETRGSPYTPKGFDSKYQIIPKVTYV